MTPRRADQAASTRSSEAILRLTNALDHFRREAAARAEAAEASLARAEALSEEVEELRRRLASREARIEEASRIREALEFEVGRLHRDLDALDGTLEVREQHLGALWQHRFEEACSSLEEELGAVIRRLGGIEATGQREGTDSGVGSK